MRWIDREIGRLSVPAVVSNITVPLLGLVDTTIAGHLGSASFIGAIAVGAMMINVAFWLFGFVRMGTTGMTAQAYGADDKELCAIRLVQALLVGFGIGCFIVLFSKPLSVGLMALIGAEEDVRIPAYEYFEICILYSPALLGTMAIYGWFVGMQKTSIPMWLAIFVNVVNIGMSLLLVFVIHLGFRGIAYGSLIANWIGFVVAFTAAMVYARRHGISLLRAGRAPSKGLRKFFSVNSDIMLRSACIMVVSLSVTAIGARLGSVTLAANAVMMQFFTLFSYFMDGLAFTGEALIGRYAGARDREMLSVSIHRVLMWGAVCAISFFIIYATFARQLVGVMTDNVEVVNFAIQYRIYIWLIPPITVLAFVYDGFFIGLTATRAMLVVTLAAAAVFYAVCFVGVHGVPDNSRLWIGFLAYLLTRGVLLSMWLKKKINSYVTIC